MIKILKTAIYVILSQNFFFFFVHFLFFIFSKKFFFFKIEVSCGVFFFFCCTMLILILNSFFKIKSQTSLKKKNEYRILSFILFFAFLDVFFTISLIAVLTRNHIQENIKSTFICYFLLHLDFVIWNFCMIFLFNPQKNKRSGSTKPRPSLSRSDFTSSIQSRSRSDTKESRIEMKEIKN